jgi:hypothetical protein
MEHDHTRNHHEHPASLKNLILLWILIRLGSEPDGSQPNEDLTNGCGKAERTGIRMRLKTAFVAGWVATILIGWIIAGSCSAGNKF